MQVTYPLLSLSGREIRTLTTSEADSLIRSGRVQVNRTKRGKIKSLQYTDERVMDRFPTAQGNRTSFREHIGEAYYIWAHSPQAFAWNNAV
jgi:hypothetical protein